MEYIRPAGLNELRCIVREELKLYGSIVSVAEYAGPRKLQQVDFFKALKQCIAEHATLAIVVRDADTDHPVLGRVEEMDLSKHYCYIRDKDLLNFLENSHNEPFADGSERPQWRVVVQSVHSEAPTERFRFQMAFVCSHNFADGFSESIFHATFLKALNRLDVIPFDDASLWQPPKDTLLPPPLEKAGKLPISWGFLLGPLLNEYLPAPIASLLGLKAPSMKKVWTGASIRPHELPLKKLVHTNVHQASVPTETLKNVLKVGKEHSSRLTGLLTHVFARALARGLNARGQDYLHFNFTVPLNLRKAMKCNEGQIGNYASVTDGVVTLKPEHLTAKQSLTIEEWDAVAATTKHLEQRSSTMLDQPIGLLQYLKDLRGWMLKKASKPANDSFELSNVGVFDGGAGGGDWKIVDYIFSQSADASGSPMAVNIASVKDGRLNLAITWCPGALGVDDERVFVEEVVGDVVCELDYLAMEYGRR